MADITTVSLTVEERKALNGLFAALSIEGYIRNPRKLVSAGLRTLAAFALRATEQDIIALRAILFHPK